MMLHINSSLNYPRKYSIFEYPELCAEMKGSVGYVLHWLRVYNHGNLSISVRQPNIWRKIFSFATFFLPEMSPVQIYQNDVCIGQSLHLNSYTRYLFLINGQEYAVLFHTKNYMSVWVSKRQVALLHTSCGGSYDVKYEQFCDNSQELLLFFCVIIDCFQYEYVGGKVEYYKLGKDMYASAINWIPSDERIEKD